MARSLSFLVPCLLGAVGLFTARRFGDGTAGYYAATVLTAAVYAAAWWRWGDRRAFSGPNAARHTAVGVAAGLALAAVFVVGAVVVSRIPVLAEPVAQLFSATDRGGLAPTLFVLVLNGVGEELVYRDVVPAQLSARGLVTGTWAVGVTAVAVYTLVTVAMGVPLLLVGAVFLGAVCQWLATRTGHLHAPVAAHLTWSVAMLLVLPVFF